MNKRWCFTIYDETYEPPFNPTQVHYLVFQHERCPRTNEIHCQGYIRFKVKKRMNTVKSYLGRYDAHLEFAKGSEQENQDYCSKLETRVTPPVEHGTFDPEVGRQGRRTDLEEIAQMLNNGVPMRAVAMEHPGSYIRYNTGLHAYQQLVQDRSPLERQVTVYVLWGSTATGKTHRMLHMFPEIYTVTPGRDPWGTYTGQKEILFDEFDDTKWSIQDMNRYLDKWRLSLDARYRNKEAMWTTVAICSNSNPLSWYPNEAAPIIDAFRRRIVTRCFLISSQDQVLADTVPSF
mgnify:CR=1 FL=1